MASQTIEVVPVIDTAAYTAADQVGGIQTLDGAAGGQSITQLLTLTVTDKAKQKAAMTIFFFDELPTVASSNNAALDITDAEIADKCVGYVKVAAADYQDVANSSIACVASTVAFKSKTSGGTLYAVAMTTGTPTYGAASDLRFTYAFNWIG